jgi:hypothetical protein
MEPENMLEGVEGGEVNIASAERLIDELNALSPAELTLHIEDILDKVKTLQEVQRNGIDTPKIRAAIAELTRLREIAEDA